MSGGAGTRLWPVSRRASPKQFHNLGGESSLIIETIKRVAGDGFAAPIILANAGHQPLIEKQLSGSNVAPDLIILEPEPRNTAPAIAAVTCAVPGDEILAVLPADHLVADKNAFAEALLHCRDAADAGRIVTLGLTPLAPETGFGYIKAGAPQADGIRIVDRFVEKPDRQTAASYIASGDYFWNAGIFVFRADVMREEMLRFCPQTLDAAERAIANSGQEGRVLRLCETEFVATIAQSIDYEIMERTCRASVFPVSLDWSDIGSWESLWKVAKKDKDGNANTGGAIVTIDATNNLVVTDGAAVAVVGLSDIVIVVSREGVLVMPKERTQDVKLVVEAFKQSGRYDLL
jgi:mannose-1-phosphate guanylyltransferase/mannose-6-phosphate isomerase